MNKANPSLSKATILIVSNDPADLKVTGDLLKHRCKEIKLAKDTEEALKIALSDSPPDLILLSLMIAKIDGHAVCKKLKPAVSPRGIPIIFLAENNDSVDEVYSLGLGAVDYITKPISQTIFLARITLHLEFSGITAKLAMGVKNIERDDNIELIAAQNVLIQAMAYLAETRDNVTGNHIRRTQHYVKALAEKLRLHPKFRSFLDHDDVIDSLFRAAPLLDIGNVDIPDRILLKPGRLTPDEFEIVKTHARIGRDVILRAERDFGVEIPFLKYVKEATYSHHEKWDGSGYPEGLVGCAIPIPARIMAVSDVYDALISRRVYKPAMPHAEAVKVILAGKGSQFDPDIADAFDEINEEFQRIAHTYADTSQDYKKRIDYLEKALTVTP